MKPCLRVVGSLLAAAVLHGAVPVEVATKPSGPWKTYATRTLDDVPASLAAAPDANLDRFGGLRARPANATGFFRIEKINGRWWLVDPDGGRFINKGIVAVAPLRTPDAEAAFKKKFGNDPSWAADTVALLRAHGFNGTGAWTDQARLRARPELAYTPIWNFLATYARRRGVSLPRPNHPGDPADTRFIFEPGFEAFCDDHAQQLTATCMDPWLLGHFSDNELPFFRTTLDSYLKCPADDPGRAVAVQWLRSRHGQSVNTDEVTERDRQDFLSYVVDRYLDAVGRAMRTHDPNHLLLGPRFHWIVMTFPEVFRAAGPHLDVVAVNYYRAWSPDAALLAMWERESGRPFLISEWYAKSLDVAGLANTAGAGWVVKTQRDRGRFYENFTLGLLESRACVGWHWFRYADNDPADAQADPSNTDANKGIVSNRYQPYVELLASMKRINERVYGLVDAFDQTAGAKSSP